MASLLLIISVASLVTTPTHLKPITDVLGVFTISCNKGDINVAVMPNLWTFPCAAMVPTSVPSLSITNQLLIKKPSVEEQLTVLWVLIGINNGPSGSNDTKNKKKDYFINAWNIRLF